MIQTLDAFQLYTNEKKVNLADKTTEKEYYAFKFAHHTGLLLNIFAESIPNHYVLHKAEKDKVAESLKDIIFCAAQIGMQYDFRFSKAVINDIDIFQSKINTNTRQGFLMRYVMYLNFIAAQFGHVFKSSVHNAQTIFNAISLTLQLCGAICIILDIKLSDVLNIGQPKKKKAVKKETKPKEVVKKPVVPKQIDKLPDVPEPLGEESFED